MKTADPPPLPYDSWKMPTPKYSLLRKSHVTKSRAQHCCSIAVLQSVRLRSVD